MMNEEEIKHHLMSANTNFRRLADEHQLYEDKLRELYSRHMTDSEHLEELTLKKKKLHLKDQMSMMIQKFRNEALQHT